MRSLRLGDFVLLLAAVLAVAALCVFPVRSSSTTEVDHGKTETIYVLNKSSFIKDATIRKDIPSWEQAANGDFAKAWDTPQVKLELVHKAPAGAITAVFRDNGPVQGALAYHSVFRGVPGIVVYAGVAAFYGYSNSVSFTHELFELLADPAINNWNWHWQSDPLVYYVGKQAHELPRGAFWFSEVCDPVEAFAYQVHHVAISDWVTPNWFGDQVNGPYDGMNVVHEPLQTLRGGYSQFEANGYNLVQYFRHAGPDAAGFLKGERLAPG